MLKKFFRKISDVRIVNAQTITPPLEFIKRYPVKNKQSEFIVSARNTITNIIKGEDKRLMVIVGPCSIHDPKSAREYAQKLAKIRDELAQELFIVMRVYFEKPRTTIGWKGLIYDPDLDNSFDMEKGFDLARHLLLDLTAMQIPAATEYLDMITPQYIADLISWGAIGARTTESQTHRELASGLSCPVGFKNGTDGNVNIAIDAIVSAAHSHMFWSINKKGLVNRYTTSGNPNCHVILRGGKQPNYDADSVNQVAETLIQNQLAPRIMVDCSHANSQKKFQNQRTVSQNIAQQISQGAAHIFGVMIESHLVEGRQNIAPLNELEYGVSITDGCIGWADTEILLRELAAAVKMRNTTQ